MSNTNTQESEMKHTEFWNNIYQTVDDNFDALTGGDRLADWPREKCREYIEKSWEIANDDLLDGCDRTHYIDAILDKTEERLEDSQPGRPPLYAEKMKQTALYLTADMINWLKAQPEKTMSEAVRRIITQAMNHA